MNKTKDRRLMIRLTGYEEKRLKIVSKQFENPISEIIRNSIKVSLDKVFEDYPQLREKIK